MCVCLPGRDGRYTGDRDSAVDKIGLSHIKTSRTLSEK